MPFSYYAVLSKIGWRYYFMQDIWNPVLSFREYITLKEDYQFKILIPIHILESLYITVTPFKAGEGYLIIFTGENLFSIWKSIKGIE